MKEHDFDGAIQHVVSYGINPAYEIKDANIGEIENTIRHALTLAKRMQDDGNVVVDENEWRQLKNIQAALQGELNMIQAAQEGNDER